MLKFYKHLCQGGHGLCVPRVITKICFYTYMLHPQNIPPQIRRKPEEKNFCVQNSQTQHEKKHNLLLSRTASSHQCDMALT